MNAQAHVQVQPPITYRANAGCDETEAILDSFANSLRDNPSLDLLAIVHLGHRSMPGAALRPLWFVSFHLAGLGIDTGRIKQALGAPTDEPMIECRLVQKDAVRDPSLQDVTTAYSFSGKYDEGDIAIERENRRWVLVEAMAMCELESVDVAGFGHALQVNTASCGTIILHRGEVLYHGAGLQAVATVIRSTLRHEYGIANSRISIRIGDRRAQQTAELWIRPVGSKTGRGAPPN